jgi:glycosyltransferase involved in cell wall biosynthesis
MTAVAKNMHAAIGSYLWCAAVLERFTLPRTLGVFCNSSYTESVVKERARQTWLVPNAVRREFFETPLPSRPAPSKPILLNVGAVSRYKRQLELLALARELHQEGLSFQLRFVGRADRSTKYGAAFLDEIAAAERDGFARYLGTKSLSELTASLDRASALIHVASEEAFGLVVAEALSRNLKFFGTMVGGVPDIAEGVEGAELFSLNDEKSLRLAIANWLRKNCARPGTAATEMRGRYYPDVIAKRHLEIYREILGHGP